MAYPTRSVHIEGMPDGLIRVPPGGEAGGS
jgi:hypothetical protein